MLKVQKTYSPFNLGWFELHVVDHCNLNCLNCNHHSLFFKKKEYSCTDYFPWIDEMRRRKINFGTIGVIGGEPFLHSDLEGFCRGMKERYGSRILITTNGYWLRHWEKHVGTIMLADEMVFSIYEPIEKSMSREELDKNIEKVSAVNPKMNVRRRDHIRHFSEIKFTSKPEIPSSYCDWQADCTNLLADGRLARCGVGAYANKNPGVTEQFSNSSQDMFYDLSKDNGRDFGKWKKKYPLEGCKYCTMWKKSMVPWQNIKKSEVPQAYDS
jgi:organic radical activating enzyme